MWWNKYIGIPYEFRGRTKEGADCYGIVEIVQREVFGVDLPNADTVDVPLSEAREGDMVRMTELFGGRVLNRHCGIITGDNHVLHTTEHAGSFNEHLRKAKHKIKGVYRVVT